MAKLPSVNSAVQDMGLDLVEDEEDDELAAWQPVNVRICRTYNKPCLIGTNSLGVGLKLMRPINGLGLSRYIHATHWQGANYVLVQRDSGAIGGRGSRPLSLALSPQGGEGTRMHSERAALTPSPPWGRARGEGELCSAAHRSIAQRKNSQNIWSGVVFA